MDIHVPFHTQFHLWFKDRNYISYDLVGNPEDLFDILVMCASKPLNLLATLNLPVQTPTDCWELSHLYRRWKQEQAGEATVFGWVLSQALSSHLCLELTLMVKPAWRKKWVFIMLSSMPCRFSYYKITQRAHSTQAVNRNRPWSTGLLFLGPIFSRLVARRSGLNSETQISLNVSSGKCQSKQ